MSTGRKNVKNTHTHIIIIFRFSVRRTRRKLEKIMTKKCGGISNSKIVLALVYTEYIYAMVGHVLHVIIRIYDKSTDHLQ